MKTILGIDIGATTTKIAGLAPDGGVLSALRVRAEDPLASLYGAFGSYLSRNHLSLEDVGREALTGVGASYVEGDIYGLPTCKVDEFSASGAGALALSGQRKAVIATMGTGTAFLWAEQGKPVRHLCGSGIGGGTLVGLCQKLAGTERFDRIQTLAEQGDLGKVDLTVGDITCDAVLDPSLTAANFGRVSEDAAPADLAAGAVNLVLQAIGTMTVLACRGCGCDTVVLTGSVATLSQARANFENFHRFYGIRYNIPECAAFATAIGAALCSLERTAV